jgi:transcriptional regulator with XRE-family HTH domain
MLTFGERLRKAREQAGLTQIDVYKAINLNNKSLSRYENNATSPDPETVKALILLYNVSADFILGLSDHMPKHSTGSSEFELAMTAAETAAPYEAGLQEKYLQLSPDAKAKVIEYIDMLLTLQMHEPK